MLIRHSFFYLLARGLPGLVNFFAIALYTRLLSTEEFGRYTMVVAGVGLVHVIIFLWLLLVAGRLLPAAKAAPEKILNPLLALFFVLAILTLLVAAAASLFLRSTSWRLLIVIAAVLAITQAWHELNLRLATAELAPARYGKLSGAKALLAVAIGGIFVTLGFGALGPLLGLAIGSLVASWLFCGVVWRNVRPTFPDRNALQEFCSYGLPLTITFALVWITSSSDRLIIGWLLGEHAAGVYAVGYDLAQQSLGLLLTIVNTAALPLAINKLERNGSQAAGQQLKINGQLIFFLAFAGAAWLIASGPSILSTFVGPNFRASALEVFPWIAIMAAGVGVKSYHFDLAFHLSKSSKWLILTSGAAAIVNIAMNFVLLPRFGIIGAAWAGLSAISIAIVCSAILGRRQFPMPAILPLVVPALLVVPFVFFATRVTIGIVAPQWVQLTFSLSFAGGVAILGALIFNIAGVREITQQKIAPYLAKYFG